MNVYFLHYELETQVPKEFIINDTKYLRGFCCPFCVCSLFLLYFDESFISCSEQYLLLKPMNAFIVSKAGPQRSFSNIFLFGWFHVHTYREDLLMWFYVTYPTFSYVLTGSPYSPLLCLALLQYFGVYWTASIRKVTSDFVFKDSYLFIKMLHSSQYSVSMATQPGFSCNLLALCSIAWSWQQIHCNV